MSEQNNTPSQSPADLPDINVSDDGDVADHRRPLLRAAKWGAVAVLVITIISLALWGNARGPEGLWGVLIGAAIGGGFILATVGIVLLTSNTSPQTTVVVMLGTWLLKIIVVLGILLVLRNMDFFDHTAMGVTVLLALLVGLVSETIGVITTRVTNV
ncbi:MAG: hypothetical protein L0J74_13735 [Corynebacterium sp.]|uniref:hypothetical protein n=1 Tax=Corynebacterium TaxID=1716 RepID=UPI0026478D4F|nr:hypothetical protein [Corynebacterium sp.]MDN5723357.1 hypothetical protein [Corynebacterium sp.]MDN6306833.1 hypothetical protein [Corynebacterium sp.]MDN6368748.1 hypothetical protein [Corynebacterium sp.]MDN6376771.1 hypothetical protein [Corynebacterium sp.]MDN6396365.1 hypothetical protein [Corynebacterium sp.]